MRRSPALTLNRNCQREPEKPVIPREQGRCWPKRAARGKAQPFVIALAVLAIVALGYFGWRGRVEGRAGAMLADASIVETARVGPPAAPGAPSPGLTFPTEREKQQAALAKFKAVADQYPSTDAGLFAHYREATILMALDNPADAMKSYQVVIDRAGDRIYGQMARLGLAEAQARGGQYDSASTRQGTRGAGERQTAYRRHTPATGPGVSRCRQARRRPAGVHPGR